MGEARLTPGKGLRFVPHPVHFLVACAVTRVLTKPKVSLGLTPPSMCAYLCMRTTIDLPDTLFERAKSVALQRRLTLKSFITQAVQHEIDAAKPPRLRMTQAPISLELVPKLPPRTAGELAAMLEEEDLAKAGR